MKALLAIAAAVGCLLLLTGFLIFRAMLRGTTWHPDLRNKRLGERMVVNLDGLGTATLPPSFKLLGLAATRNGGGPAEHVVPKDRHRDTAAAMFRFEQGHLNDLGGNKSEPVLLNLTLYPTNSDPSKLLRPTSFFVHRYFSPTDSTIPFDSPRWKTEPGDGTLTRWLEMDDPFDRNRPRWAILHIDARRNVRIDFFAWRREYPIETALKLVRDIAGSVVHSPELENHLRFVASYDQRMTTLREQRLADLERRLASLGIPALKPGEIVFSTRCAAWLDADRDAVWIGRYLGRFPFEATSIAGVSRPKIALSLRPDQYPGQGTIAGLPSINIDLLWVDPASGRWRSVDLQRTEAMGEEALPDFVKSVLERVGQRNAAHLFRFAHFYQPPALDDLEGAAEFLSRADQFESDLAAGKILGNAAVEAPRFEGLPKPAN